MDTVQLGIVGLGFGQSHVDTVRNITGMSVTAVADNAPVGGETPVSEYAANIGAAAYEDGVKMIAEADINAVDLVVAPRFREPLLKAAAGRGLPVLMEKPMATSVAQAEHFAAIAADAGIALMIEYPMRFFPAVHRAKALLNDGPLSRPLNVSGNLQTFWNPPPGHWTWDDDNVGGLINECSCHLLDTLCFLCGRPERVFALGGNVMGHGAGEDTAAMLIEFAGGCTAVANVGGLGTWAFGTPMQIRIFAESGEARISGDDWTYGRVEWALRGSEETMYEETMTGEEHPAPPRNELLRCNIEQFARVVHEGIEPPCGPAEGILDQKLIAAIVESIRSGQRVNVK